MRKFPPRLKTPKTPALETLADEYWQRKNAIERALIDIDDYRKMVDERVAMVAKVSGEIDNLLTSMDVLGGEGTAQAIRDEIKQLEADWKTQDEAKKLQAKKSVEQTGEIRVQN